MSSLGITGTRKWMPLFAATSVVMVEAITLHAMIVAWEQKAARLLISMLYAFRSKFPIRYLMNSLGSVPRDLYGGVSVVLGGGCPLH